ncbi:hypothetical protein, partial [Streptomyces shaanxiensis]
LRITAADSAERTRYSVASLDGRLTVRPSAERAADREPASLALKPATATASTTTTTAAAAGTYSVKLTITHADYVASKPFYVWNRTNWTSYPVNSDGAGRRRASSCPRATTSRWRCTPTSSS